MSVSVTLKNYIQDKITALSSVQQVYGYEPAKFDGYPAVTITLPVLEGDFSSNAENERTYGFRVAVYFPLGQDIEKPKTMPRELYAENVVATVIEEIIDTLDTDFTLEGVTQSNSITCRFGYASDMIPSYAEIDGGWYRMAEITIAIYTEKIVT